MVENLQYYIGQILSIIAVILGFVSFQMKTPKGILTFQIITASLFSAHYLLIEEPTGMALNVLAVLQCVVYYIRDRLHRKSLVEPIIFTALVVIVGIITWNKWYSVFILVGLVLNSVALAFSEPQKTRALMLLKSPMCLIYNLFAFSWGGIAYETASFLSSLIGIIKKELSNRKKG